MFFVFDTNTQEVINLTEKASGNEVIRFYESPVWSLDDKTITSRFTSFDQSGEVQSTKGTSSIDIESGNVDD